MFFQARYQNKCFEPPGDIFCSNTGFWTDFRTSKGPKAPTWATLSAQKREKSDYTEWRGLGCAWLVATMARLGPKRLSCIRRLVPEAELSGRWADSTYDFGTFLHIFCYILGSIFDVVFRFAVVLFGLLLCFSAERRTTWPAAETSPYVRTSKCNQSQTSHLSISGLIISMNLFLRVLLTWVSELSA